MEIEPVVIYPSLVKTQTAKGWGVFVFVFQFVIFVYERCLQTSHNFSNILKGEILSIIPYFLPAFEYLFIQI